jgi:DNA-binding response OmpR family regulator
MSTKKRILCVDDNEDSLELICLMLCDKGFETLSARSFAEALRLIETEHFDLVLLDLRFPDGDGVDLCTHVRHLHQGTPVVFFSASATTAEIKRAMECGADAYLTKPRDLEKVPGMIASLLKPRFP